MHKDTRPRFLGGQFISKIEGVSEVQKYIAGLERTPQTQYKDSSVSTYYETKLKLRHSLENVYQKTTKTKSGSNADPNNGGEDNEYIGPITPRLNLGNVGNQEQEGTA